MYVQQRIYSRDLVSICSHFRQGTQMLNLDFYLKNIRILGVIAILVCLGAWAVDIFGVTYKCPFCRAQRTVIGLLGLIMVMGSSHFILKYIASVLAYFGSGVAMMQHFNGWRKIHGGEFSFHDPIYFDSFILSFLALFIIGAQVWIIILNKRSAD